MYGAKIVPKGPRIWKIKIRPGTNNVTSNGFVCDPGLEFTSKTPTFTLTH